MPRKVRPQRLHDVVKAAYKALQPFRGVRNAAEAEHEIRKWYERGMTIMAMRLVHRENGSDGFILVGSLGSFTGISGKMTARDLDRWLLDPDFDGILWDNKGLQRVLTRDILQEGLDVYRAAHRKPRAPLAEHVGVFLWEQTISREESDQRSQASTGDSTGPEDEPDQSPLET